MPSGHSTCPRPRSPVPCWSRSRRPRAAPRMGWPGPTSGCCASPPTMPSSTASRSTSWFTSSGRTTTSASPGGRPSKATGPRSTTGTSPSGSGARRWPNWRSPIWTTGATTSKVRRRRLQISPSTHVRPALHRLDRGGWDFHLFCTLRRGVTLKAYAARVNSVTLFAWLDTGRLGAILCRRVSACQDGRGEIEPAVPRFTPVRIPARRWLSSSTRCRCVSGLVTT